MDNTLQLFIAAPDTNLLYSGSYSLLLVLISVSLAILAAFASLNAAARIDYQHDRLARAIWIAISALTLGLGIWAMHFVGMLALNLPCGIYYDPWITLLSMIPGILASGIALGTVRRYGHRPLFSSILLGAGIGAMHYTGMAALRLDGFVRYDPKLFALSILVAVALSYLALSVKNRLACTDRRCTLLIAVIIGSAVSGMHYTAMSAAYFVRGNVDMLPPTAFTPNTLALLVSLTTVFLALIALAVASVSGNRQAARQLRESEERWKFALEGAGDGVWDWNPQTDEAHFSRRWKAMIGYGEHEFPDTGAAWIAHLHPEDAPGVQDTIQRYFSGELPDYAVEFRMRCKDGAWKWILARGMVVERNEAGKPVRMIGTHTDIDYRKRAEEAMLLHASVYDNAWEGIMITDAQANIVSVNAAFTEVTGYTLDEVRGQNPRILKSGNQDSAFYQGMWENLLRTGHWRGEIWNKKKNGEVFAEILSIGV
ncbi:MAG: MHYT domain-containing protein, partial [Pseudomonadota bacterium]